MDVEDVQIFSRPNKEKNKSEKKNPTLNPQSNSLPSSESSNLNANKSSNTFLNSSFIQSFNDMNIHNWLSNVLYQMAFKKPTPIQQRCIEPILNGNDMIACAETGSGKTAAFAIPILQLLSENPYPYFALILTPTRELAVQIAEQIQVLGVPINIRLSLIIGGLNITKQINKLLFDRPHIIVATPGRIWDILTTGKRGTGEEMKQDGKEIINMSNLRFLVLDEADRMLQDGSSFLNYELPDIIKLINPNAQMLAFSATMTSQVFDYLQEHRSPTRKLCQVDLSKDMINDYISSSSSLIYKTAQKIKQRSILVPSHIRHAYLLHLLQNYLSDKSVIVFVGKCRACELTFRILREFKLNVGTLHSKLNQKSRLSILGKFRSGRISILICTDVASRGLDLPLVSAVVNMELPADPRDYVHRIGRTGRAGRAGLAISFISERDVDVLNNLQDKIGLKLEAFEETPKESDIINLLNKVGVARQKIMIFAIDDEKYPKRKNIQNTVNHNKNDNNDDIDGK